MLKSIGTVQPFILATLLALGLATLWGIAGVAVEDSLLRHPLSRAPVEVLRFRADGTPLIQTDEQCRDLKGHPVAVPALDQWLFGVFLPAVAIDFSSPQGRAWGWRLREFRDGRYPNVRWYFVAAEPTHGSAYFVGYDPQTATRVGFLGTAGFRAEALPPGERFPFSSIGRGSSQRVHSPQAVRVQRPGEGSRVEPPWEVLVQTDDAKLYQIDLGQRTVRVAQEGPVLSSRLLLRPGAETQELAVRTEDAVLLLDLQGAMIRRFTIPPPLQEEAFSWAVTSTGEALIERSTMDQAHSQVHEQIDWADAAGRVQRQERVALPVRSKPYMRIFLGVILPEPLALDGLVGFLLPWRVPLFRPPDNYAEEVGRNLVEYWPALLLVHLLGGLLAWLCYRRQVRYGASRAQRVVWPVFVFLFGVPGWVGYRWGRSWPALERCPACGTVAPRDRVGCAVCQAEFPLPALRGTEVFA
jgi:hypothetical protein